MDGENLGVRTIASAQGDDRCGMKSDVNKEKVIDNARIEVVSGEGDQTSRVDASQLDPDIEPLVCRLHRETALDGGVEREWVPILMNSGSDDASVSEDSVEEPQRKASGPVQMTRPLHKCSTSRNKPAFDQKRTNTIEADTLNLIMGTAWGTLQALLSLVGFPGE